MAHDDDNTPPALTVHVEDGKLIRPEGATDEEFADMQTRYDEMMAVNKYASVLLADSISTRTIGSTHILLELVDQLDCKKAVCTMTLSEATELSNKLKEAIDLGFERMEG